MPGATLSEQILARASGQASVRPGQVVDAAVDLALSHDNSLLVSRQFKAMGAPRIWDPDRCVVTFDHRGPAATIEVADGHREVREFLRTQGVTKFYDVGYGICHQVLPEEGLVRPGMVLVGTDSHTTTHGAFGAFSLGIGATEMAGVWATGRLWFRVPESVRLELTGRLQNRVYTKDLILHLIGENGLDGFDYRTVEFTGSLFDSLTVDSRMTMANLAMEMGAKNAFCPVDEAVLSWLERTTAGPLDPIAPDADANYERRLSVDVSALEPQVACPNAVDNVKPVSQVRGTKVDQVFIGTCTNGRLEDLQQAADILRGEQVAPSVRVMAVPASRKVFLQALQDGTVQTLTEAGVSFQTAGCGPCLGAHQGLLGKGEVCFSTTNRNFQGRMGHRESQVYLGSPATAAATALYGEITDPRDA
jgi:homoaconitate hydratase family protein